jgi:ATP-dependent helicase/nuclease subunit B
VARRGAEAPGRRPALQSEAKAEREILANEPRHVHELIPQLLALPEWPPDGECGAASERSADFQVCWVAGAQTRGASDLARPADLEIGDTAGLETCATTPAPPADGCAAASTVQRFNGSTVWPADSRRRLLAALANLRGYANVVAQNRLRPELADSLYGPTLRTSVSRLESFAACPFKFFVHAGLRAEERLRFELDPREQGSFQHEVLAAFHEQLRCEGRRWRDLAPEEAREWVRGLAEVLAADFRERLFSKSAQTRFAARMLTEALEDFIGVLVGWMRGQYEFDPVAVELAFGETDGAPAWELDLGAGRRLALRGRIDRVDLCRGAGDDEALCVVVDYKSSQKELDPVLLANGVQLQLPAYLNVLQHWPEPRGTFGVGALRPAGVFYVSLRGIYARESNRSDALADAEEARRLAYQHAGRFDASALGKLDNRGAPKGDQFNYRRNKDGSWAKNCREALSPQDFATLLGSMEENLKRMGREIFAGAARVDPYRHKQTVACDQCSYQAICRIDPWTHRYRALRIVESIAPV